MGADHAEKPGSRRTPRRAHPSTKYKDGAVTWCCGIQRTGSQLRWYGVWPQPAANVVGLTDKTDLFYTMKAAKPEK